MFPVSTRGGGKCTGFPDVCKVPAPPAPFVPTPFPNVGDVASADKVTKKVFVQNKAVVHEGSEIPRSSGDEAGTLKGMVSNMNMAKVKYTTAATKVKVEGQSVVTVLKQTQHNGGNAVGSQLSPSQTKVIIL